MFCDGRTVIVLINNESDSCESSHLSVEKLTTAKDAASGLAAIFAIEPSAMNALLENETFIKALDDLGFRDVSKIDDIEKKIKAGKRFYTQGNYGSLRELDITNISKNDANSFASDKIQLLQSIDKSCLREICPTAYDQINAAKKRIKAANAGKAAKAEKNANNKRKKEIEKAKQILQEAGEL